MHRDVEQTMQMLTDLKDGDKPVQPGDTITTEAHGVLTCSKVYGWKDGFTWGDDLKAARFLKVSWFREGSKRAEVINLNLPTLREPEGGAE